MPRVFLCNSGAEAVEAAIKFARLSTGRIGSWRRCAASTGGQWARCQPPGRKLPRAVRAAGSRVRARALQRPRGAGRAVCDGDRGGDPGSGPGRGRRAPGASGLSARPRKIVPRSAAHCSSWMRCRPASGAPGSCSPTSMTASEPDLLCVAKSMAGGLPMGAVLMGERVGRTSARPRTAPPSAATRWRAPPPWRRLRSCARMIYPHVPPAWVNTCWNVPDD